MQSQVEKLDQAISVIESLNSAGTFGKANQPTRIISQASRRKMAQAHAQESHWASADDKTAKYIIDMERKWAEGVALITTWSPVCLRTISKACQRKVRTSPKPMN